MGERLDCHDSTIEVGYRFSVDSRQIRALAAALVTIDTRRVEKNLVQRFVVVSLIADAIVGGLVGLGIGLHVYAPTAWFAVFEIGMPVAVAGGCVGLVAAGGLMFARRVRH